MNLRKQSMRLLFINILMILGFVGASSAATEVYSIDNTHSSANWVIRHVVSKTSGTFSDVQGKIEIDPEKRWLLKAEAVISVYSIDSHHRERDTHLLTGDFFNAHEFNAIQFTSMDVQSTGKNTGILHGRLTLHGVTKEIEFPFEILGFGPDPWGGYRVGLQAATKLKRSDFGITWGLDMPGGGPVGDDVEVALYIEGVKLSPDGKELEKK